jgi:hypothetical protein
MKLSSFDRNVDNFLPSIPERFTHSSSMILPDNNMQRLTNKQYQQQICHRCQLCRWQIATGINDAGGKFAIFVNDTGDKQ